MRSNAWDRTRSRVVILGWSLLSLAGLSAEQVSARQSLGTSQRPVSQDLTRVASTRIADPKLDGGGVLINFSLGPVGVIQPVVIEAIQAGTTVATIFVGPLTGSATPYSIPWDGKTGSGDFVDPGDYRIRVRLDNGTSDRLLYSLTIVRLGITEIEAQPSLGNDEWQMVYFMKQSNYSFYATPAIHEYLSVKGTGEVSDLDLDNGQPRPAANPHLGTAEPAMEGSNYEDDSYNYPLCYLMGRQPVFEVTFGQTGTSASGLAVNAGFPVAGYEIRALAQDGAGAWTSSTNSIAAGGTATFTGPALPNRALRHERQVVWSWQYRRIGEVTWAAVPGSFQTTHRFFTMIDAPQFLAGTSGTQYSGPWVEVAEFVNTWSDALSIQVVDETTMVEAIFQGFMGQQSSLATSIEGVIYDCYPMGGDGGATHYYQFGTNNIRLSRLLNGHALGVYVNCSDCSSSTAGITGMLGVSNVKMLRLGNMNLKAIWGIGCPDYTLSLWGGGSHRFSYHHIVTRSNGDTVCDACMRLDVDGSPSSLPGTPGWNCDRPWTGTLGYDYLSASNNVSRSVETLPKMN